jgi:RHH-type rel operon transcriptional repressor/antitoxin RelB
MVGTRLPEGIEQRLSHLAEVTGRTKSYYVREALEGYLDDMEDLYIGLYRLENPGEIISHEEMRKEIGLEN